MFERIKSGRALSACLAVVALLITLPVSADPPPLERIPDVLEPWIPWVLEDLGDEACPLVGEVHTCVWPSSLDLTVSEGGGSFTLKVTADQRKGHVSLPGSSQHWPEEVKVDGKPAAVIEIDGSPALVLEKGSHVVTGRFTFSELPDSLEAPPNLGTLVLTVAGKRVAFPKREASGLIWLQQGGRGDEETDRLDLTVHRKLTDGVPLTVVTRIQISASGKAREVVLPQVLVPGTRAIRLDADLPAQVEADGTLRMQALGGNYRIEITAVRDTPAESLSAPKLASPWPENEIWVWVADERLRHAELSGAAQIDPARTDLASDWLGLPTYVLGGGKSLAIGTRRRGEPEPPPNQVHLARTMWLDLDGDGYTVRDNLTGTLRRDFRLDLSQGELGHAVVNSIDELITEHQKRAGVELRSTGLNLSTEWRLPHGLTNVPAVGYDEDVQSLSTQLYLPPGFRLLGAQGVDHVSGTWLDTWDLFDFFFVLIVSLAVAKLCGKGFGVVALLSLALTHDVSSAPKYAWVFLLIATALLQVVKSGRFEKGVRVFWLVSVIGIVLVGVPFAVDQVREALYPHLAETGYYGSAPESYSQAIMNEAAPAAAPMAPREAAEEGVAADVARKVAGDGDSSSSYGEGYGGTQKNVYARTEVDANAVVQTGPGVPQWQFRSFSLGWSGPVEKSQQVSLWIAPPAVTRLWSILNVLLSGVLLFALGLAARKKIIMPSVPPPSALALLLGLGAFALPSASHAQVIPSPEVLQTLRERLTQGADCAPDCLSVERLDVTVEGSRLKLVAVVHAASTTAYRAPGPLESWAPDAVRIDGKEALATSREDSGFLLVRLDAGLHDVELSGPIPGGQALTLALGDSPHRVTSRAPGWQVEGLTSDGHAESSLVLRREVEVEGESEARASQSLAQWLVVKREFDLGVRFRVHTTVTRLGPATESVLVRLPLLPGESVLDSNIQSDGKTALVELGRDQSEKSLESTLGITKRIDLTASTPSGTFNNVSRPWNETWVVRCSALYHCGLTGIAPFTRTGDDGMLAFQYKPWPGEKVSISAERLEAARGASVTIDSAELSHTPGARMEQSTLTLSVRTSRGTTEKITLPPEAALTSLEVDGTARPARVVKGVLEVQLDPGSHAIKVMLQAPRGIGLSYRSDAVSVSRPLVNVNSHVHVPEDRWLLFVTGPSWGPAVLFWGYLIVVLLAAFALSRVPHTPLKPHAWILLGLGLTQAPMPVVVIVVGWLFALALRERARIGSAPLFNLMQVSLVFWTVLALGCLAFAVHQGLVVQPDMQVHGLNCSNTELRWYVDRTTGAFPEVGLISVPLWVYKGLMLVWALWLAASVIRWLRWGFSAFRTGGAWRPRERLPKPANPRVAPEDIAAAQAALDQQKDEPRT